MEQIIRQRLNFGDQLTINYLDDWSSHVLNHRGVEHPFLNRFEVAGANSDEIKILFLEFYYFIRYLPFYIAGMALRTRDENILREIVINVAEEVGERDKTPHLDMYREFLRQIFVTNTEINHFTCLESTRMLDRGVEDLYTRGSIETALGAMYALETMSSSMVSKLNNGLECAGFDSEVRAFFILHIDGEKGHSNGAFNAIFKYLGVESNRVLFEDGIKRFMQLMERFWDGVEQRVANDSIATMSA